MDASALQDKVARGLGIAARKLGSICVVYRPKRTSPPLDDRNRIIKLFAAFEPEGAAGQGSVRFQPLWRGVFDASYTSPGDYIVGPDNTYFVGVQTPTQPIQCVLTNRRVTLVRPGLSSQGGYSGLYASGGQAVLTGWPAALFADGLGTRNTKVGSSGLGSWRVLLPELPATPRIADVVTDDLGSTYIVDTAEQNSLGWQLLVRQISA